MERATIEPGDRVFYVDIDKIEWGPWEVLSLSQGSATVRVEGAVEYLVPTDALRRLKQKGPTRN